jgi:polyphosphate kinase
MRRNGKEVIVMLELKARFDEEANLEWKNVLEEEGVKVLLGVPQMKVHAKLCIIKKRKGNKTIQYGFVSTGNLNEKTSNCIWRSLPAYSQPQCDGRYQPHFPYVENWKTGCATAHVQDTAGLPGTMRNASLLLLINREIKHAKAKKEAKIILKVNSLSDAMLIEKLNDAASAGVEIRMIVRGIFCAVTILKKQKKKYRPSVLWMNTLNMRG